MTKISGKEKFQYYEKERRDDKDFEKRLNNVIDVIKKRVCLKCSMEKRDQRDKKIYEQSVINIIYYGSERIQLKGNWSHKIVYGQISWQANCKPKLLQ